VKNDLNQTLITYNKNEIAESYEDVQTLVRIEKHHFKKGNFYMTSFDLDKLILEKKYGMPTMRVLIVLKARLDFNNRIRTFRQTDIAREAGTSQANVSRALKQLEADKVIIKNDIEWYFNDEFVKGAGDRPKKRTRGAATDV
jgi:CRP-like cAMP-binding protein